MMTRSLLLVGLGASVAATTGGEELAPVVTKYRLETSIEQVVDLSAVGQPEQRTTAKQLALFTVTLTDSAGGRAMHVTIDSVDATGPGTPPRAVLDSAKGAWIHGFLAADGKATITGASSDSSDLIGQLKTSIQTFHPRVRPPVQAGDRWVDTTAVESRTTSQSINSVVVTTYTAAGEEQFGGVAARRIDAEVASKGSGTIQNPALGAMDISSEENGTRTYYLSPSGRYLGGSGSGTAQATVSAAALPTPLPITIIRETKVSVVE